MQSLFFKDVEVEATQSKEKDENDRDKAFGILSFFKVRRLS